MSATRSAMKKPPVPVERSTSQLVPFVWEGTDKRGVKMKGEQPAKNANLLKAELRRQGINPTVVKPKPKPLFGAAGRVITPKDIAFFSRQMATMMKSGVPIVGSLEIIGEGHRNPRMKKMVGQIRAALPDCEFLFTTGVFGSADPRSDAAMAAAQHSGTSDYGRDLKALADELGCAYFDMTTPWIQYVRSSGLHPHLFYRDRVHANAFGEQILAKIMLAWWTP